MRYENIKKELLFFEEGEKLYQQFYQICSTAYTEPIKKWEELRQRFSGIDLPCDAPTPVAMYLTEKDFFPYEDIEVNCFKNLRYCPAFLHKLEFIKIVYVLQGKAVFYFSDKIFEMNEGQFCIVSPGIEQAVFSSHDEDCVMNILLRSTTFTSAFAALLAEQNILSDYFWKMSYAKYSDEVLFFTCTRDEKLEKLVLKMYAEIKEQVHPSNILLKSYVMIFLGEALRRHRSEVRRLEKQEEQMYRPAMIIQEMKDNLKTVNLKELARKWRMSENDLNHLLKVEVGYSYAWLLMDIRMRQAADYLLKTEMSVERIMEEIGLNDLSSFYRHFKKRYGMTPQNYRIFGGKSI